MFFWICSHNHHTGVSVDMYAALYLYTSIVITHSHSLQLYLHPVDVQCEVCACALAPLYRGTCNWIFCAVAYFPHEVLSIEDSWIRNEKGKGCTYWRMHGRQFGPISESSHSCTVCEGIEVVTDWSGIGKVERSCNPSTCGMHVDVWIVLNSYKYTSVVVTSCGLQD